MCVLLIVVLLCWLLMVCVVLVVVWCVFDVGLGLVGICVRCFDG